MVMLLKNARYYLHPNPPDKITHFIRFDKNVSIESSCATVKQFKE